MDLAAKIRDVPDFPKEGILFKDITTLLHDPLALREMIRQMADFCQNKEIDFIVGIEARGFIFGVPLACELGVGFIPVRKPGKLPAKTIQESYVLEYGTNTLEMHEDACKPGQRVMIVDDLLATGGTAQATCNLVERLQGEVVGLIFAVELAFLEARQNFAGRDILSVITF